MSSCANAIDDGADVDICRPRTHLFGRILYEGRRIFGRTPQQSGGPPRAGKGKEAAKTPEHKQTKRSKTNGLNVLNPLTSNQQLPNSG